MSNCAIVMALATASVSAGAQVATIAPASGQAVFAGTTTATLRAGTTVPLRTLEALTTKGKHLKVGQRFNLETTEAISLNGMVVIPAGSPAVAEVTDVRNKGMWGKSGRINVRVLYVRANGRQIRMTGQLDDKGTTGTAGVVGSIAVIPIAGFFVTGTSANIPINTPATGFLDEDVPVSFAAGNAPAPMVVAAPAAPAPIAQAVVAPAK